eukprot:TRINITY_DN12585_c0_g1_i1.p1 TRINITY_DN12585_c0_g1~~TRINITY_DN12585_c0_g1_i1.p1  ORF type:complete len:426 (+),score=51.75 TRINITY_DN12585_c0_g1_i1:153-1280(+)
MALAESKRSGASLVPDHLYRPNSLALLARSSTLTQVSSSFGAGGSLAPAAVGSSPKAIGQGAAGGIFVPAPREAIKLYSSDYYAACTFGGMLCCGLTHAAVTPMDVIKCNMQIDHAKFPTINTGLRVIVLEQGSRGLFKGFTPALIGYSAQGACKYGFYEYFKKQYTDLAGPQFAKDYKTVVYLAASASAEFIADIALCPFEAVKVRVQTNPTYARGLVDGLPKMIRTEGFSSLYNGIVPLWGRQIPYTMMKFGTFENTVEFLYKHVVPRPKSECSSSEQLGVSFVGGYIAGVACAIISHPADNLVSFLNNAKGATVKQAIDSMGMKALFTRGLGLRILMVGTLTGAQWGIYDSWKVLCGFPTTGGPVVVEDHKD